MSTAWIVAALSILGGDGPRATTGPTAVAAKDTACCADGTACAEKVAGKAMAKSDVEIEITAFEPDSKTIASAVDVASRFFPRLGAREMFELAQKFNLADGKVSIDCDLGVAHGKAVVKIIKQRQESPAIGAARKAVETTFSATAVVARADGPEAVKSAECEAETSRAATTRSSTKVEHAPRPATRPAPVVEDWPMSLSDAIRVGLDNSEVVRVISLGVSALGGQHFEIKTPVPLMIAPLNWDAGPSNFRSAMMAHVRSIEQQYWAMSQQQVQVSSRETAVKLAEEIVRRERSRLEAGRGNTADVAEAQQSLENFQLSYNTAVSDAVTIERQLRNILGLPVVDSRRIVPATAPLEAKVEPDWETGLAAMMANQPDIVSQREQMDKAIKAARASEELAQGEPRMVVSDVDPEVFARVAKAANFQAGRQKAFYRQVVHQSTHSLARFFLEVDANYKQFQTARRLREAARTRLEASRAAYDEGRAGFTVDRVLDAINQYANALSQEAQFRASYNTSIAALEEAKGTLLEYDKIAIAEPSKRRPYIQAPAPVDGSVKAASHDGPSQPQPQPQPQPPAVPAPAPPSASPAVRADGTVVNYRVEVKTGPRTVKFEGSITSAPTPSAPTQP